MARLSPIADALRAVPAGEREAALDALIADLDGEAALAALYDWSLWARPEQMEPPGEWDGWLYLAGRGSGKTRAGSEWVRQHVLDGSARRIALIGQTSADVRQVMVEGESGLLAVHAPAERPVYQPSRRTLTWPNGAIATTYSGDSPDQLRGPQHDLAWADEAAKWQYPDDTWSNLELGLRLGPRPRWLSTTTPRPIPLIRQQLSDPRGYVTRGSTYGNAANLPASFLARIRQRYEGTRLGRQELLAELLDDVIGALWSRDLIDRQRVRHGPRSARIAVGVDPQGTRTPDDDDVRHETGIVVVGRVTDEGAVLNTRKGLGRAPDEPLPVPTHGYVLEDLSGDYSPHEWASLALRAYRVHEAQAIVAEVNYGGDMVTALIRSLDPEAHVVQVRASRGKARRAEPIAGLYEQGRMHHVGMLPALEDEMCTWTDDGQCASPNRMDALVWAAWYLMIAGEEMYPAFDPSQHVWRPGAAGGQ